MTNSCQFSQAATELLMRRTSTKAAGRLAIEIRPTCIEDALFIQEQISVQRTDSVAGWKCLLPINENQVVVAPIFSDTVNRGESCQFFADNSPKEQSAVRIEPEIAFILGKDLPARPQGYSQAEIDYAVLSCHMALELMQDRFAENSGADFYEKLADCLVNQGLFIGPEIDKAKAYQASEISIRVSQAGNTQCFAGKHPNQYPQAPLYWLINYMGKRGIDFKAGQAIITGSYAGIVEVKFASQTEIAYLGLGKYSVEFSRLSY